MQNFLDTEFVLVTFLTNLPNTAALHGLLLVFQLQLALKIHLYAQFIQVDAFQQLHGQCLFCVRQIFVEHLTEDVEFFQVCINEVHQLCHKAILAHIAVDKLPILVFHRYYAFIDNGLQHRWNSLNLLRVDECFYDLVNLRLIEHLKCFHIILQRVQTLCINISFKRNLSIILLECFTYLVHVITEVDDHGVLLAFAATVQA